MTKTTRQATAVTRKAMAIYEEQKETYQKMLRTKVRQGKKVTAAAKEASAAYKQLYGATPTSRWHKAPKEARRSTPGTVPVAQRPARKRKGAKR